MKKICDKNRCTGCSACINVCPKKCITMKEDEYGVLMPYINEKECINCNMCEKKKKNQTNKQKIIQWNISNP